MDRVSGGNTTTTLLANDVTFTGSWESIVEVKEIIIYVRASHAGTLNCQFNHRASTTGAKTIAYTIGGGSKAYALKPLSSFFRLTYVNGATTQTTFVLTTIFKNAATSGDVSSSSSLSAGEENAMISVFGERVVVVPHIMLKLIFAYGINNYLADTITRNTATATVTGGLLRLQTGATTDSICRVTSRKTFDYLAGLGVDARFTAIFTTGVANSSQIIGVGSEGAGFFFGYNGATFGVLRRTGGNPEVRTLTITNGATTAGGNITITLNGGAGVVVAIANGDSITETCKKIADTDFADEGGGWITIYGGNTVAFISIEAEARAGAYSFADTGTTGVAGSFAQTLAGAVSTDTWVAQTAWNLDPADSSRTLPTLTVTNGNVYRITYQWLGFGAIVFSIENPDSGHFVPVHMIQYANSATTPSTTLPSGYLVARADNGSTTSNLSLYTSSMAVFSQGGTSTGDPRFSTNNIITIGTTEEVLLVLRINSIFGSQENMLRIKIDSVSFGNNGAAVAEFRIFRNTQIENASGTTTLTFADVNTNSSIVAVAKPGGTDAFTTSGGDLILAQVIGATSGFSLDLSGERSIIVNARDIITVSAILSTGAAALMSVNIGWSESF